MIRMTTTGSEKRVAAALATKETQLSAAIIDATTQGVLALLRRVQQKLSGEVLQQRSGTLIGSATATPASKSGGAIVASVQAGAGPAWAYAPVHEYGGKKAYVIKPKNKLALAFFGSASTLSGGERKKFYFKQGARRGTLRPKMYEAFHGSGGVVVKSVTHPPLPARPYMRTSYAEMKAEIQAMIYRAAAGALRR